MLQSSLARRRFLHLAGGAAAVGLLGAVSGRSDEAEKPVLRFVQWNDMHVDSHTPSDYRLANEKMKYLVDSLNAAKNFPVPDFVVAAGDLITGEGTGLPKMAADFALLKSITAGLKCPLYPVMGNHEDIQQEGNAQYEALFCKVFGDGRINYTFQRGGILFVMLNDSGAPFSNETAVGQARDNWLAGVLKASPTVPKIICCHVPLAPLRQESVLKQSFGFGGYYAAHDDKLLQMIDDPANKVLAVLSGHLHLTGAVKRNGVYHISVSGSASYPNDFGYYQVFADHIHVKMYQLPPELVTPTDDIHGKPRWPIDYSDATHPTHQSYVAGNSSEREFDMPLLPKQ